MHQNIKFGKSLQGLQGRKVPVYKLRFNSGVNTEMIKKSLLACKLIDWADLWYTVHKGKHYNQICFACFRNTTEADMQRIEAIVERFKQLAIAEKAVAKLNQLDALIMG